MDYYGTLGPSCSDPSVLAKMIRAGMTGIRLNLSHGNLESFGKQLDALQEAEAETCVKMKKLIDVQGRETRTGTPERPVVLKNDQIVYIGKDIPLDDKTADQLENGMVCFIDDGKIKIEVIEGRKCKVIKGGLLLPRKSFAVKGKAFDKEIITPVDEINVKAASAIGIGCVMQPFVRSADDVIGFKKRLAELGASQMRLFAKIEDGCGLSNVSEIADAADCIVFARGDLGNNIDLWRLPGEQKKVAAVCKESGKPFIVATQLLSSMESSPVPTRAELNDIYNSVLDGAEGLMLTGETAAGKYPDEAMKYLVLVAEEAVKDLR